MQMGLRAPWVVEKEDGMPECRMKRKQYTWISCVYPNSKENRNSSDC
jgi:hypothetical protein